MITVVTAPTIRPITLAEAKDHLRVTGDVDDAYIESLIDVAVAKVELDTHRALLTQTLRLTLDAFPCGPLKFPRPPIQSISTISYVDGDGASQSLSSADYLLDIYSEPGRLSPVYGESWPTTRCQQNAVTIQFIAGWTLSNLPATVKQLCNLWVSHFFENREPVAFGAAVNEIPHAMRALTYALRWGDLH